MSDPFIGEIRLFTCNFAPLGWYPCDGAERNVAQLQALYAVIGNTYGGTYPNTFKVPDLRGRAACGAGSGPGLTPRALGKTFGGNTITLDELQMPAHSHMMQRQSNALAFAGKTAAANNKSDLGTLLLQPPTSTVSTALMIFQNQGTPNTILHPETISASAGTGLPHNNTQPYQAIGYYIAYIGIFPSWD